MSQPETCKNTKLAPKQNPKHAKIKKLAKKLNPPQALEGEPMRRLPEPLTSTHELSFVAVLSCVESCGGWGRGRAAGGCLGGAQCREEGGGRCWKRDKEMSVTSFVLSFVLSFVVCFSGPAELFVELFAELVLAD